MSVSGGPPQLVLAGLGHAHLFVLEALAAGRFPDVRVTLVTPESEYFYSGMVTSVVAGLYSRDDARLRPGALARGAGVEWRQSRVDRIDASARRLRLEDGAELSYDLLSCCIGARIGPEATGGWAEGGVPVKPFRDSLEIRDRAISLARAASADRPARLAIAGGGAAGWEMAVCLQAALAQQAEPGRWSLTLLGAGPVPLTEHAPPVRERAREILEERGIRYRGGARVVRAVDGTATTAAGDDIPFDLLLWATGPRPPELFRRSGLATDGEGYLRVARTLEAEEAEGVFGAGDCITLRDAPWVDRAGVYSVREGELLARNLAAWLRGAPREEYDPQRHWLSLMSTGDEQALMSYCGIGLHARPLWWLKDRIDRRFMERFQRLER